MLTRFQSSTQLELEFYYHVKKLINSSLNYRRKIINAIQHIRSKSKQRIISQRIFRFVSKGALSIECEFFEDCINRLEVDARIRKKREVNASFFINSIAPDSNKNHGLENVERVQKSPESPKTIGKLASLTDHDLEIFKT